MNRGTHKQAILIWILLNFECAFTRNDASFCFKKAAHYDVVLEGKLKAGIYTHWEPDPSEVSYMTIDRCTEHCCRNPDIDVVFLLDRFSERYCFCVKCHSDHLCFLKKITPPPSFTPITVTLSKSISKLSTTTAPFSDTWTFTRTKPTKSSTKSSTVKREQTETKRTTERTEDVATTSGKTTSDHGLGRRTGSEGELGGQRSNPPNLEVRNAHLPELNGYSQGKQEPSNKAVTPYNGINRVSESITTTSNIGINITTPNVSSTGPTTPRPTRVVKTERKAEGTGNDDISLQCQGALKIIRVAAFGIPGDNNTVSDFDKHCHANLAQVDGTNVCIVSLKRVYKTSYPPFIKTIVTYTCSYTEEVS
ncbi:hypothetical protein ABFA07_000666 [Porites harrisoni]